MNRSDEKVVSGGMVFAPKIRRPAMRKISIAAKQGRDSPRKLTTHDFADLPLCPDSLFLPVFSRLAVPFGR